MTQNNRNYDNEIDQFFGSSRFVSTDEKTRFGVLVDHYSQKCNITPDQVKQAYEATYNSFTDDKIKTSFAAYFSGICKSIYTKENEKATPSIQKKKEHTVPDYTHSTSKYIRDSSKKEFPEKEHSDSQETNTRKPKKTKAKDKEMSIPF